MKSSIGKEAHKIRLDIKNEIRFFYDAVMRYASFFGSFLFFGFAVILFYILHQTLIGLQLFKGGIVVMFLEYTIKVLYKVYRPDFKTTKPISLFESFQENSSFPSGHSALAALFTTLIHLTYGMLPLTVLFMVMTILTGLSRIALKRHYVSDVVAGYVIGIIIAVFLS